MYYIALGTLRLQETFWCCLLSALMIFLQLLRGWILTRHPLAFLNFLPSCSRMCIRQTLICVNYCVIKPHLLHSYGGRQLCLVPKVDTGMSLWDNRFSNQVIRAISHIVPNYLLSFSLMILLTNTLLRKIELLTEAPSSVFRPTDESMPAVQQTLVLMGLKYNFVPLPGYLTYDGINGRFIVHFKMSQWQTEEKSDCSRLTHFSCCCPLPISIDGQPPEWR